MEALINTSDNLSFRDKRIALLYDDIVRPDTTGVYCKKALEKICEVTHFQPTELDKVPSGFDLYLFIDDGFRYFLPEYFKPSAWWVIDTHLNYDDYIRSVSQFNYVFTAQKDGALRFRKDGISSANWLPLGCDPNQHKKVLTDKKYDVVFVGNALGSEREKCLNEIKKHFPNNFIGKKFFNEMAEIFSQGRIVFNRSVKNDVNMRVFEALSTGSLLLTNNLDENGQGELFEEGKHLVNYNDKSDLIDKIKYYLEHEEEREKLAETGMNYVHKYHTYQHRMAAILQNVFSKSEIGFNSNKNLKKDLCSIVILTHNQVEYTKLCVESIESFVSADHEIIFVDNASTDGTIEYLTSIVEKKKNYSLIKNSENRGYAAGNNIGLNAAEGEFVLIMNNDILVTKGAVESLIHVLKDNKQTALTGPKTNFVKGSQLDLEAEYGTVEELIKYAARNSLQKRGSTSHVEFLVGFMFLGKTKLLKEADGFDESFGIGNYEDNDLCRKLTERGYDLRIAEDSFVHHFGHISFNASEVDYNELIRKNKKIYEDKWRDAKEEKNKITDNDWITEEATSMLLKHGKWCAENGFWEMALKSFSSLIELEENSENLLNYGVALWETGDHESSFGVFTKALELDPTNGDAIVNLVDAGYNLEKHVDVESSLNLASKNGGPLEISSLLADCQYKQGKYEKAAETLSVLLEKDPENEEFLSFMNLINSKMANTGEEEVVV